MTAIPNLPLTRVGMNSLYVEEAYEANPLPYTLWVREDSIDGRVLGLMYVEGRYATYEGACTKAYLLGQDGRVEHAPYRLKPFDAVADRNARHREFREALDMVRQVRLSLRRGG